MNSARQIRRGFTLVELLVVIGIIALLISILLPALSTAQRRAQEVLDLSNIHQVAIAIINYSVDNNGKMLPAENLTGGMGSIQTANQLLDTSWNCLTAQYKIPSSVYGCNTLTNLPQSLCYSFGLYQMNWQNQMSTIMGWNYFGGRIPNDSAAAPGQGYRTYLDPVAKTHKNFNVLHGFYDRQASSQVLLTCINYDTYDVGITRHESICPHYKGTALFIPGGSKWKKMDGLNCAFLDGHAVYVPYAQLTVFQNSTAGQPASLAYIPLSTFAN